MDQRPRNAEMWLTATDCPPLYATPRDPTRETLGAAVAEVAETLGTPLTPWQCQAADLAMELDPQMGLLAYGEFDLRRQRGAETIRWHNGSLHGITAPGRSRSTLRCSTWPWSTRPGPMRTSGSSKACRQP
jgi:hypothetical protein